MTKDKIIEKLNNLNALDVDSYCYCLSIEDGCCGGNIESETTGTVANPGRGRYVYIDDIKDLIKEIQK